VAVSFEKGIEMLNHDKNAIQVMKDFVEGKTDITAFKFAFENNKCLKETLNSDPLCPQNTRYLPTGSKNIIQYLESIDWVKRGGQLCVWGEIERFLVRYNYPHNPTKDYREKFNFLLDIQPRWLDILDEKFLIDEVISKIPEGLTKGKKIAWCKTRIKQLFQYEKSYPRWVQSPEWPIVDGIPLIFKKQENDKNDSEKVNFIFYNSSDGEEHIVVQWY